MQLHSHCKKLATLGVKRQYVPQNGFKWKNLEVQYNCGGYEILENLVPGFPAADRCLKQKKKIAQHDDGGDDCVHM